MSKVQQLPTQKGTQAYPVTTQMPAKLVIKSVQPDSPVAGAVVDLYGGRLKQFHVKQQQNYSLSETNRHRAHIEWPGARATYVNDGGQEYLTLEVDPSVLVELSKQGEDIWDFALIELFVPDMRYLNNTGQLYCYAQITTPLEEPLTLTSTLPFDGVASNVNDRPVPDKLINAATSLLQVRTAPGGSTEAYASFIVDLRPARGLSVVTVDLYPYVYAGETFPTAALLRSADTITSANQSIPAYDSDTNFERFRIVAYAVDSDFPYGWLSYPGDSYQVLFDDGAPILDRVCYQPAIHFEPSIPGWVFDSTGTAFHNEPLGNSTRQVFDPFNPPLFVGVETDSFEWYRHWYISTGPLSGYNPYTGPETIPGDVEVTVFKGVPPFDATQYTSPGPGYAWWTFADRYPDRPGHGTPGRNVPVPVYTNADPVLASTQLLGFYGVPRAGTVTIELKTGRAFWGTAT